MEQTQQIEKKHRIQLANINLCIEEYTKGYRDGFKDGFQTGSKSDEILVIKDNSQETKSEITSSKMHDSSPDFHSSIKQDWDKDKTISADDFCECGHPRNLHYRGKCNQYVGRYAKCGCSEFALSKEGVK